MYTFLFTVNFSTPAAHAGIAYEVADPCKNQETHKSSSVCAVLVLSDAAATMKNGAPPPPVIRRPKAAADPHFIGAQLYFSVLQVCD